MAHKKGQGSSRNGRDSQPQRRGVSASRDSRSAPAISSCVRSAIAFMPVAASAKEPILRSTLCSTASSPSTAKDAE